MEKNINKMRIGSALIALLMIFSLASCNNGPEKVVNSSAPPVLKRVSLVHKDSTTTEGKRGQQYLIIGNHLKGTRSVTFNGASAYVNRALTTNKNIIVQVPQNAPFRNASDSLVVTNNKGSASLPFHIVQPPPTITNFMPKAGAAGDTLTIVGKIFDNVKTVRFGDATTGKKAKIVSATHTQIKVIVPQGAQNKHITVITPGGSATSKQTFGFQYLLYGDSIGSGFVDGSYNSTEDYSNTEHVAFGKYAVKVVVTSSYGGMQLTGGSIDLSNSTAIKLSVYIAKPGGSLNIYVNGNYKSNTKVITPPTGKYKTYTIPLSTFGNLKTLKSIVIQGYGEHPTFYIDNFGVI